MGGSMVAGYPHRIGGHCGSGSLRDLLEWAGLSYGDAPMGEGAVFGLVIVGRAAAFETRLLGAAILLAAVYVMAVVPRSLARRWRTPPGA